MNSIHAGGALTFLAALTILIGVSCAASRPATYEAELVACNRWADTLQESIACENKVRRAFDRPLRDAGADK